MKRGFTLLETLVVISMVSISLLLLYKTVFGATIDNKRNVWYDDASNIYKTFYLKEYLMSKGLDEKNASEDIKEITCDTFGLGCERLVQSLGVSKIYVVKYGLKDYDRTKYKESFNKYIDWGSKTGDYPWRLVVEFQQDKEYFYASLDIKGDSDE